MTEVHNCGGYDDAPGRDCTAIGSSLCFAGQCVTVDWDCAVNVSSVTATFQLILSNSSAFSGYLFDPQGYLPDGFVWDNVTQSSLDVAGAQPDTPGSGYYFTPSTSITGYYDLHWKGNDRVLTYNPITDYMFFNDSTSEGSSIWLPDQCDGTISTVSYSLHVAMDGRVLALPTSTGAYSGIFAQTTERSLNVARSLYANPAQRISLTDTRLAPNGFGTKDFRVPDFTFKECCDNYDICFDDCSTVFTDCNSAFLSCMEQSCSAMNPLKRIVCNGLAFPYYAAVSSPAGVKAFIDARKEACEGLLS